MNELKQEIRTNQDLQNLMKKRLWGSDGLIETYIVKDWEWLWNDVDWWIKNTWIDSKLVGTDNKFSDKFLTNSQISFVCLCTRCREIRNLRSEDDKVYEKINIITDNWKTITDNNPLKADVAEGNKKLLVESRKQCFASE